MWENSLPSLRRSSPTQFWSSFTQASSPVGSLFQLYVSKAQYLGSWWRCLNQCACLKPHKPNSWQSLPRRLHRSSLWFTLHNLLYSYNLTIFSLCLYYIWKLIIFIYFLFEKSKLKLFILYTCCGYEFLGVFVYLTGVVCGISQNIIIILSCKKY